MQPSNSSVQLFSLSDHPLLLPLQERLQCSMGKVNARRFPDGESYLQVQSPVEKRRCVVLADLVHPNSKYLPLLFLLETLKDLGADSIGLIVPYLPYMRQDSRFHDGEAVTSKIFAASLSRHADWLVTMDPHLHRYHSLNEIYSIPNRVVHGAPALARWLQQQRDVFLVGPDEESEQWVKEIAEISTHPFVIGRKQRYGDRNVEIQLPELSKYTNKTAIIIDDVISSGHTVLQCIEGLRSQKILRIECAAIHGIFADGVDQRLLASGLNSLVTSNTIAHASNKFDVSDLLIEPVREFLRVTQY